MTLQGKVAVVTGARQGIGRGVAHELAQQGARVFATYRTLPAQSRSDATIVAIQCDHRQDPQVEAAFAQIARDAGTIDILVNNVWGGYERMVENGKFGGHCRSDPSSFDV